MCLFLLPVLSAIAQDGAIVQDTPAESGSIQESNTAILRLITGTVKNEEGEPLSSATVLLKGTVTGTFTDQEGKFSLDIGDTENPVLMISFVGYESQEITLGDQSTLAVVMTPTYGQLDEVVVVGYGAVRKRDLTGSVSSISSDDFVQGFNNSPEQLIQGKVPGVTVSTGDGTPGGAERVRVRGITSLRSDNDPLYI
ncbi:MAG: carboxypeptidase-like regulatory domain-containing protein, partial [Bacteroidota bacterium]